MTLTAAQALPPTLTAAELRLLRAINQLPARTLLRRTGPGSLALTDSGATADWLSFKHLDEHGLIDVTPHLARDQRGTRLTLYVAPSSRGRSHLARYPEPLPRPLNACEKQLLRAIAAHGVPVPIRRPARGFYEVGHGGHRARLCTWHGLEALELIAITRTPMLGPTSVIATERGRQVSAARHRPTA
ncbi:hypothetical protein [Nonomuraea sp. NPDC049646]|uniref:hypothetical protein n=1 Tax=unclassified Nonomuraea TaxID=2593643 RepID=UPI0037882BB6